ncbi:MAG: endonuclease/exonuclease/phosphatase family protein [Anaerolineae bacterium]
MHATRPVQPTASRLALTLAAGILTLILSGCLPTATPPPPVATPTRGPATQPSPTAQARVVPIFDIQLTDDPDGESRLAGETVTTRGIVTAVFEAGERVFIQDAAGGPWSGIFLFRPSLKPAVGDEVEVTGRVREFKGITEIEDGEIAILGDDHQPPAPIPIDTRDAAQEQWESTLLRVENVSVTDPDLGHGEWQVDDGSGALLVDDLGSYNYSPSAGDALDFVVGPLYYSFDSFKLEPRDDADIGIEAGPVPAVAICQIQGADFSSSFRGRTVTTRGIVTADLEKDGRDGFFLQHPTRQGAGQVCDGDPATSDGLFVFDRGRDLVSAGDEVIVRGEVKEFFGLTEIAVDDVEVVSSGNALPEPVDLDPPADADASRRYFEAREGMLVRVPSARVVGPTNRFGEFAAVTSDAIAGRHVFENGPVGEVFLVDDAGVGPFDLQVSDNVALLEGPLDFSFGNYKLQLVRGPTIVTSPDQGKVGDLDDDGDIDLEDRAVLEGRLGQDAQGANDPADLNGDLQITDADLATWDDLFAELTLAPDEYTVATFNVENFFDDIVDQGKTQTRQASSLVSAAELELKLDKLAEVIHDDLREPTILGLQEVEKTELLEALAARPEIETQYDAVLIQGPDNRGINVGLMYDRERVNILESEQLQGCTTLSPNTGGPGMPCDTNGDGTDDGNLLFGRPPLQVRLLVNQASGAGEGDVMWVIVAHFKSKRGGAEETEPRRIEQARFLAGVVNELLAETPGARVIILGDLNDFFDSPPINTLTSEAPLGNLWFQAPAAERYSFIFEGRAEVLDHVLITPALVEDFVRIEPVHINADFPDSWSQVPNRGRRSSDHDPVLIRFRIGR